MQRGVSRSCLVTGAGYWWPWVIWNERMWYCHIWKTIERWVLWVVSYAVCPVKSESDCGLNKRLLWVLCVFVVIVAGWIKLERPERMGILQI